MASTNDRGYGAMHQKLRKFWAPKVRTGGEHCRRCNRMIRPMGLRCSRCLKPTRENGHAGGGFCGWDLGHDDFDRSRYTGPEHSCCNRATSGRSRRKRKIFRANWW